MSKQPHRETRMTDDERGWYKVSVPHSDEEFFIKAPGGTHAKDEIVQRLTARFRVANETWADHGLTPDDLTVAPLSRINPTTVVWESRGGARTNVIEL